MEPIIMLPAREKVAEELRKAILKKELVEGQEISQEKIAKQLGISRMPVREAFQILEREGLILTKNRKTVVAELSNKDIIDHIEIRALLEGEAAERACLSNKDLGEILAAHEEVKKAVKNKDKRGFATANEKFHKAIWTAADSKKLKNLLIQLWDGLPPHLPILLPYENEQSTIEHEEIVNALKERDAVRANKAMKDHLTKRAKNLSVYFNDMD